MDDEVSEIFDHTPRIGGDLLFQQIDQIADRFADNDIFSDRSAIGFSIADEILETHPRRKFLDGSGRVQYVCNVELFLPFRHTRSRFGYALSPQL